MTRVGAAGKKRAWRSEARANDVALQPVLAALGAKLVARRKSLGLTQEAIASKASIDARHVQDLEYGRSNATIATLRAVAIALETTVAELLRDVC